MKPTFTLCLAVFLLGMAPAHAHDPAAGNGEPKHGGQYAVHDIHYGIEFLNNDKTLEFHMTEHLVPKDMTGSQFKVLVQRGGNTEILQAKPDGTKLTVGIAKPVSPGDKIVLTGRNASSVPIHARFVVR